MTDKGLFLQNVIAVIWDFDRTLSPQYMQKPLFEAYDVDENTFWEQVGRLPAYYRQAGIHVQRDTCYLGHILSYVRAGRFKGLTNARLRDLGKNITFYRGLPFFLDRLKTIVKAPDYAEGDLRLEHYVVSTGLRRSSAGRKSRRNSTAYGPRNSSKRPPNPTPISPARPRTARSPRSPRCSTTRPRRGPYSKSTRA